MKKSVLSLSLIAMIGLGALTTPSCKKYEEGPGISLMSKKARLTGTWKKDRYVYSDNTEISANEDAEVEFKKDGTMILTSTNSFFPFSISGTWEFSDNKERLTTKIEVFGSDETETAKIILLKNKEFATEDEDGIKTYYVSVD